jgi:hypothetical protein
MQLAATFLMIRDAEPEIDLDDLQYLLRAAKGKVHKNLPAEYMYVFDGVGLELPEIQAAAKSLEGLQPHKPTDQEAKNDERLRRVLLEFTKDQKLLATLDHRPPPW